MTYLFGECELDPGQHELRRNGRVSTIEPKVFDLLLYLVENRDRLIGKDELNRQIWQGRAVSDASLSTSIKLARQSIGDNGKRQDFIRTVPRRGFRFVGRVEDRGAHHPSVAPAAPAEPDKPSIAVLPFENLSGDPEQEYFADGISEDIISSLSKLSQLLVIARNSSFSYKGKAVKVQQIAEELGVRYVVEGSVRKAGDRVRITAQLIDCTTGGHLWGDRFDRDLTDVFALQDEVTYEIVSSMALKLTVKERRYLVPKRTNNMAAYDHFLRGYSKYLMRSKEGIFEAKVLLQQAVNLDPEFAAAHARLAVCHLMDHINRWYEEPDRPLKKAYEVAQKAVALDQNNPTGHVAMANVNLWKRRHDRAIANVEKAIELDPNFANGYVLLGCVLHYAGQSEKSVELIKRGVRFDPHLEDIYLHWIALAYFQLGQYDEAVKSLRQRIERKPDTDISRVLLAACHGHLGQTTDAKAAWDEAHRLNPIYSLDHRRRILPYKNPADFDHIVDGLRKAGLAE